MTPSPHHPLTRPTLVPGLRRLWRGRHHLQLGVDPARAVVLELPDPRTACVLDLLDGGRSERTILAQAGYRGVPAPDAWAVIDQLRAAGLVVSAQALLPPGLPGPVRDRLVPEAAALALHRAEGSATPAQLLRQRAAATVMITGSAPIVAPVAVNLARAGVGHISPVLDDPADRGDLCALLVEQAPGTRTAPVQTGQASFVVHVGDRTPAVLAAERYARRRLAHLAVSLRDGTVVIGPLVPPNGSPCLHCVDLHRRDRDPDWSDLAAQLATDPPAPPCAATAALIAAGVTAREVLNWLDGAPAETLGASVEITARGQLRRRSWPPHPRCGCGRRTRRRVRGSAAPLDPGQPAATHHSPADTGPADRPRETVG